MNSNNIPNDRIILDGMEFYGFHGCNDDEKQLGQKFLVNVEVEVSLEAAGKSDDLNDTVSYSHLFRAVKSVFEGPPRNLLETVAGEIAEKLITDFPVTTVTIRVMKMFPPIKTGLMDFAGVQISRRGKVRPD